MPKKSYIFSQEVSKKIKKKTRYSVGMSKYIPITSISNARNVIYTTSRCVIRKLNTTLRLSIYCCTVAMNSDSIFSGS